jgi:hypothetical protein
VNNLDDIMFLVGRAEGEIAEAVDSYLRSKYAGLLASGFKFNVGPTYSYQGHSFSKICTFTPNLLIKVLIDMRHRRFDRAVIYRLVSSEGFRLLEPGGSKAKLEEAELIESSDK